MALARMGKRRLKEVVVVISEVFILFKQSYSPPKTFVPRIFTLILQNISRLNYVSVFPVSGTKTEVHWRSGKICKELKNEELGKEDECFGN